MTLTINSSGVQITTVTTMGTTKFKPVSFVNLNNFSMNTAFPNGAIPALVAASQQRQKGGSASFASISVVTAAAQAVR